MQDTFEYKSYVLFPAALLSISRRLSTLHRRRFFRQDVMYDFVAVEFDDNELVHEDVDRVETKGGNSVRKY